jgi:26S proteasome regulatory subunit N3
MDSDIKTNFTLLERAVAHFDPRFTLRVLRSISSMRKHITPEVLAEVIVDTYTASNSTASFLLEALGKSDAFENAPASSQMEVDSEKSKAAPKETLAEVDAYLSILVQIYLFDKRDIQKGAQFSTDLIERLRALNRRTLDSLAARVYFYYSLFYEQIAPLPPSPAAAVTTIRQPLLAALRTAVLRKDVDTQATVMTLLLRNYLSTSHISQADLLISHNPFPVAASNNQIARYLYYLGRIRAIQLQYTEAHSHLIGATRKSPASPVARGFYQASHKLLVVVELLMGDIPDRAVFRQPALEQAMHPYLLLSQAVGAGDLDGFLNIVNTHSETFRKDGTYTLILRLRQNVIKTGIRMMSLSYSRISLRDICLRLGLDSEESAEYIVAKAIRDGVIEATLDHEHGFMKSKEVGDIYATREPGEAFHERIRACLALHDESVKVCSLVSAHIVSCGLSNTIRPITGYAFPHEPAPSGTQECPRSPRAGAGTRQGDPGGRHGR